jgi:hypothetical protein
MDIAKKKNGDWIIMEIGDAHVIFPSTYSYFRLGAGCGAVVGPSTTSVPSFKIFIRSIKTTRSSPVAVGLLIIHRYRWT